MFEQAFKNIDNVLWKDAGCTSELDYTEQSSWLLFLKYLDGLEEEKATTAALHGKPYTYILDQQYRWSTWAAPKGDVLYTVTGSFGIPVIVRDDAEFCFQRHIGLIRPKSETSSAWLYYLLLSPQLVKQSTDGATGTAQKTVSLKLLRSFVVPKVTLKQQKQVVEKLDALVEETQKLESLYQTKLDALDELKKSLLHQAFSGALQSHG